MASVLVFSYWQTNYYHLSDMSLLLHVFVDQKSDSGHTGLEPRCWGGCVPHWRLLGRICHQAPTGCLAESDSRGCTTEVPASVLVVG